jgi:glutathione synthase/RimK-type ligase-like ATP-grasp enzyme
MSGECADLAFRLASDSLRAIYFRRPVFLREPSDNLSPEDQLARTQWAAFMRTFMLFDDCRWMNHPAATYRAETKALQLAVAADLGFRVPSTMVSNTAVALSHVQSPIGTVVVKSLDTMILRQGRHQSFSYTQIVGVDTVREASLASAPAIFQQPLEAKLDLRVTVVGDWLFCVSITHEGQPIRGDWRLEKRDAEFAAYTLPSAVSERCLQLVRALGLSFGAIDLAFEDGEYFFLEINPTGEWAWLREHAAQPIDEAIASALTGG